MDFGKELDECVIWERIRWMCEKMVHPTTKVTMVD